MPDNANSSSRPVRDVADAYVTSLAALNPLVALRLGLHPGEDRLPDLSPAGHQASDDLARSALAGLAAAERAAAPADGDERRCGRLLRERLEAELAMTDAGEYLRNLSNIFGPVQQIRGAFMMMPAGTDDDWAVIARRMARVPAALTGYRASLEEGIRRGLLAAPRQVSTIVGQFDEWAAAAGGRGWFADFAAAASVPPALRADLDEAAAAAMSAVAGLRGWLTAEYLPRAAGIPDGVGEERYRRARAAGLVPTLTRPRPTPGAGRNTSCCAIRCRARRSRCCPVPPPWPRCSTWNPRRGYRRRRADPAVAAADHGSRPSPAWTAPTLTWRTR